MSAASSSAVPTASAGERTWSARSPDGLARAWDIEECERMRKAVEAVGQATYHWNLRSDRLTWAGDATRLFGKASQEALASGRGYAGLLDADNFTSRFEAVMRATLTDDGEGVPFQIEYKVRPFGRDDEREVWIEDIGRWFADENGRPAEVYGVVRHIDDRRAHDQHLRFLGNCDPLTGMMNRARLAEALGEAMAMAQGLDGSCAFLVAEVSNLPVVNDAYGFDIADEVIVAVGRRLRQVVRTGDAIGRYSGSKFGVILLECGEDELHVAAERFLSVARDSVIETERGPVWAMLSIGGLVLPKFADEPNAAMAKAEEALTEAKRQPSDAFVAYRPSPERLSIRGLNARCAAEIVSSLREDRFTLAYQPIVSAATGRAVMHEALLRMSCQDGETVAAVHLIPIAEKLGLVRLIDRAVMAMAIDKLTHYPDAVLSLNVSGTTATDPRWFAQLIDQLREHREITDRLTVEITETVALNDLDETVRFIGTLRELGCKVAIDDFGAGYTSFRNLKVLSVDMVKIDGSFCERLSENRDNQYFVRSLVDLAKKFGLDTVAEWVEEERDAELLREWGVDYLQGHLFGAASTTIPWTRPQVQEQPLATEQIFDATPFAAAAEAEAEADGMARPAGEARFGDDEAAAGTEPFQALPADQANSETAGPAEPDSEVAAFVEAQTDFDVARLRAAVAALDGAFRSAGRKVPAEPARPAATRRAAR